MDGQLKVAGVQVTVNQNDIWGNMTNVEKMAMKVAENEKNVDLILFHEACLESGTPLESFGKEISDKIHEFWKGIAAKTGTTNYPKEIKAFYMKQDEGGKTVSAVDFIKKLIIHIPEKHFKMIRYYGIYAKHHKHENKLRLFIPKEKRRFHTLRNSWRTSISLSFHFDPLLCKCGHKMTLFQICLNGTPFFEKFKSWGNSS